MMEMFKRVIAWRHMNLALCDSSRAAHRIDASILIAAWARIGIHVVIIRKPQDRASNFRIMIALELVLVFSLLVYDLILTLSHGF